MHRATWEYTLNVATNGARGLALVALGSLMQAAAAVLQYVSS
jgi:hypothetical protein